MSDIFYSIRVLLFFKKIYIFAMSICYFNNPTMMALNQRGQTKTRFLIVTEQLLTNR